MDVPFPVATVEDFFPTNEVAEQYDECMLECERTTSDNTKAMQAFSTTDGFFSSFDLLSSIKGVGPGAKRNVSPQTTDTTQKLQALLLKRAMEVIRRTQILAAEKPSIMNLNANGALSEGFLKSFQHAELMLADETFFIRTEAERLRPGSLFFILCVPALSCLVC